MDYDFIVLVVLAGLVATGIAVYLIAFAYRPRIGPSARVDEEAPDASLPVSVDPAQAATDSEEGKTDQDQPEHDDSEPVTVVSVYATYPTAADASPEVVERLTSMTISLPRLPTVALDLLPMLARPGTGAREVAAIVQRDQASAARILRWVNSSLFGLEGKVDSLHRAVTLLGLDTVRSAVLEDALGRSVDLKSLDGFGVPTVWSHAAAASVAAKHLSMSARGTSPDVAATAGLLHDIGLLLLLTTEQKGLDSALKSAREANEPLIAHEDACIGFNHQTWGEVLVRAWRLPEGIATAIGTHHCPMREPFDPLAAILWLADYMISRMGFACPRDIVPWVDLDELEELMHKMGLRPPLDRYITEGLVRELVRATQQWSIEPSQVPA